MASTKTIATILTGQLLENSKNDDLITAEKWNQVMVTIRNAINNHATTIVTESPRVFSGTIKALGASEAPYWESSLTAAYWDLYQSTLPEKEGSLYTTIIPQSMHQFAAGTQLSVQCYDLNGKEVSCGVCIQADQNIILMARKPIPVKFAIRGGV